MKYTTRSGDAPHQAHVNYACPCGCIAGVIYDEAVPLEKPGSCCCGRLLRVGPGAQQRLESSLPGDEAFDLDPGTVKLPWDEVVETALAVPRE